MCVLILYLNTRVRKLHNEQSCAGTFVSLLLSMACKQGGSHMPKLDRQVVPVPAPNQRFCTSSVSSDSSPMPLGTSLMVLLDTRRTWSADKASSGCTKGWKAG